MKLSHWLTVLFAVVVIYGWVQYERFVDTDYGYVYDPGTGDIYEVELEPAFSDLLPWRNLNPFAEVPYFISSVSGVEYRGRLTDLIAENREWIANPAAEIAEINELLESGTLLEAKEPARLEEYFYLYATEYTRLDIDPTILLPPEWDELKALVEPKQLFVADVVLGGWANQKQRISRPPEFKIISPALVLRERAFLNVNTHCLEYVGDDLAWEACWWLRWASFLSVGRRCPLEFNCPGLGLRYCSVEPIDIEPRLNHRCNVTLAFQSKFVNQHI